jgi:hydroxymethylpyrimidine pyrophosphatase-like HAD family hydrolase
MSIVRRSLVLDLDFTMLHLEWVPDSIEVPGRTRSAWIAPQTVELLHALQTDFDLVLATARSWDGTRWVWDGLAARGVAVAAVVIEDGALLGQADALLPMDAMFEVEAIRERVNGHARSDWPAFAWQHDFVGCLVARCADKDEAVVLHRIFEEGVAQWGENLRFFRDGRKVYIIARSADKWSALQRLLGERAIDAAGIGDGANDLIWLTQVRSPCTLTGAVSAVLELVAQRNGYISPLTGHAGIGDVLRHLGRSLSPELTL